MKVLGLDSSGMVASVAVVEDDILLAEYTMNYKKTHSQTLLPMLDDMAKRIELDLSTLDAIAVAAGPGSFTGLRIGSATAKGLGQALDKVIVPVPTVEGLAFNLWGCRAEVCPIMDARRNQVYTGLYRFTEDTMETLVEQCAVDIRDIVEKINQRGTEVVFLGDGVPVYREQIAEYCKVPYSFAPAHLNRQRGGSIAALGLRYLKAGKAESAAMHRPEYLRLTQAERERNERLKNEQNP